jgi:hypothetical protein
MKKIYFAPKTTIVKVQLQQMIAASPGNQVLDKDSTPVSSESEIGSRGFSGIWDDDEE